MRFNQSVHLVEQRGQALHFIHHHPISRFEATDGLGEQRGVRKQVLIEAFIEQIKADRTGKRGPSPSALAHATHAEQKEAAPRHPDQTFIVANHVVIFA